MIARIPPVPRSADNAAAAAYRSGTLQIVLARPGVASGAVVAPILAADGCIRACPRRFVAAASSRLVQALATIFASHLAVVLAATPAEMVAEPKRPRSPEAVAPHHLFSTFAVTLLSFLSRTIPMAISSPVASRSWWTRSSRERTGRPSIEVMTSPAFNPARDAAEPSVTEVTRGPVRTEITGELIGQRIDRYTETTAGEGAEYERAIEVEIEGREAVAEPAELAQVVAQKVKRHAEVIAVPEDRGAARLGWRDLDVLLLAVSGDGRLHGPPRRRLLHEAAELPGAADVLAAELHDHVRRLRAGFRRDCRADLFDHHTVGGAVRDPDADLGAAAGQHHQRAVRPVPRLSVCGRCQHERQAHEADDRDEDSDQFELFHVRFPLNIESDEGPLQKVG